MLAGLLIYSATNCGTVFDVMLGGIDRGKGEYEEGQTYRHTHIHKKDGCGGRKREIEREK